MGASKKLQQEMNEQESIWDNRKTEEVIPLEFSEEVSPKIFGIEEVKAQEMVSGLKTVFAERQVLQDAYVDVIELPITSENLPTFKELRLKIVKNRTQGIEKWHTTNKAFYLAGGRFVDAIKNKEIIVNQQMEEKLMEAEKFFENQEKERLAKLQEERSALISPYIEIVPNDLATLEEDVFDSFLMGAKAKFEAKKEAERLESERIEKERIEKEKEIEAQRLENERLKKEAEEREAIIKKEREEAEAKQKAIQEEADKKAREEKAKQEAILKEEREAKEKLEAELRLKKEAEEKAEKERIQKLEAERKEAEKLAKAPIKKQLNNWVDGFNIDFPNSELLNNETALEIKNKFEAFKNWAKTQVNNL